MQRIFFRPVTFSWLLDLLCLVSNSNKFQLLKYSLKNLFKKKKKNFDGIHKLSEKQYK